MVCDFQKQLELNNDFDEHDIQMFEKLKIGDYELSIQGSEGHYSQPRQNLEPRLYDKMEIAIFKNENWIYPIDEFDDFKRIEELDDPAMTSVDIEFKEGKIRVEGYLTKTLKGNIEATIKPQKDDGRVTPHITQARYRGFYFPTAVANMMLGKAIEEEVDFLHSHPTYKNIDVNITDERMKLDYSK